MIWIRKNVKIGLLIFALQLGNIVRARKIKAWEIVGTICVDLAWVAGSFVLLAIHYDSVSIVGRFLVDLVALAVLTFAVLQILGLKRFRTAIV